MKECCAVPENLELKPDHPDLVRESVVYVSPEGGVGVIAMPATEVVRVCRVCGARHFELSVDAGRFKMDGAEIG